MNVDMAAYHTVHDYPGGSAALAPSLGVSEGTLNSKLNPQVKTHRLHLGEAVTLMDVTGDHRVFFALAERLGYAVERIGDRQRAATLESLLLKHGAASGRLAGATGDALQDGVITPREMTDIADAAYAAQASIADIVDNLRRQVPVPPAGDAA